MQNQAILLADAGFDVHIVTQLANAEDPEPRFHHANTHCYGKAPLGPGLVNAVRRSFGQISTLTRIRYRLRKQRVVEIAYDPLGVFYSDNALLRPRLRIAHLHESLKDLEGNKSEGRLLQSLKDYDLAITPDVSRSKLTQQQLGLVELPTVVENYPLDNSGAKESAVPIRNNPHFEVVYCGAIGTSRSLDDIIRSVPHWRKDAIFRIYGNDETPVGHQLKQLARELGVEKRVLFSGWINTEDLAHAMGKADLGICLFQNIKNYTALGASNKRFQYMQAGLAQIGDMIPGVAEMLEGERIGLSVRSFEPEAIAEAVNAYATDPERTRREGARAYELFKSRYNYETAFAPVLDFIEKKIAAMP